MQALEFVLEQLRVVTVCMQQGREISEFHADPLGKWAMADKVLQENSTWGMWPWPAAVAAKWLRSTPEPAS